MTDDTPNSPQTATAEEWRRVPGLKGVEVSSEGNVRVRVSRTKTVGLRNRPISTGYLAVTIGGRTVRIQNLVAAAFLGPRPEGQVVVHLDDDPLNNQASALAYATRGEALRRAYACGARKPTYGKSSLRRGPGLTEAKVREIRAHPGYPPSHFAEKFGVTYNCISCVRSRIIWGHLD
jgi:hypothetical protein